MFMTTARRATERPAACSYQNGAKPKADESKTRVERKKRRQRRNMFERKKRRQRRNMFAQDMRTSCVPCSSRSIIKVTLSVLTIGD